MLINSESLPNALIVRAALGIIGLCIYLFPAISLANDAPAEELLLSLVDRAAEAEHGTLLFTRSTTQMSAAAYEQLKGIINSDSAGTLQEDVTAFLDSNDETTVYRTWSGGLIYDESQWRMVLQRSVDDLADDMLRDTAVNAGAEYIPQAIRQDVFVADDETRVLTNNNVLRILPGEQPLPLIEFDCSLGPWHDALHTPVVDGQSMIIGRTGAIWSLTYEYDPAQFGDVSAVYEFDESLNFAPLRFATYSNGTLSAERIYGYSITKDTNERPTVSAFATVVEGDNVHVDVRVIHSWSDAVVDSDFAQSISSPQFLHIDERGDGEPQVSAVAGPLDEWVDAMLQAWGSDDPAFDLNRDGTVDDDDLSILFTEYALCEHGFIPQQ